MILSIISLDDNYYPLVFFLNYIGRISFCQEDFGNSFLFN